jgi:hypothetical protein
MVTDAESESPAEVACSECGRRPLPGELGRFGSPTSARSRLAATERDRLEFDEAGESEA